MSEGGLEILDMARGLGPASPQLCRAIANLAKSGTPTTTGPCVSCVVCRVVSCVVLIHVVQSCAKIGSCLWVGCGKYATG
jgi:hypothetical protein